MQSISLLIHLSLSAVVLGFQCPSDGYFANSGNLHSFYHCSHGIAHLIQCPSGLVWNQLSSVCDWPSVSSSTTTTTAAPNPNSCDEGTVKNCRETAGWSTTGITIVGADREFGSDARHLGSPFGIFVDRERGNVYVADTDNHRVQKFSIKAMNSPGVTVAGANGKGNASNQLNMPMAVYVDSNENVYISDTDNYRIQMWSKGATSGTTVAGGNGKGTGLNQIGVCQGLFVHEPTNELFISDFYNDRIVKWIPEKGEGVIIAGNGTGGSKANQLSGPRGIFIDECETIYIADLWNNRIQKWKKGATEGVTVAGGNGKGSAVNQLSSPWDVEVDQYGNIYIADTDNNRVMKWTPGATNGTPLAMGNGSNGWGTGIGPFKTLYSIGLDKEGNLFVSEKLNHRLQEFNILPGTTNC